MNNQQKTGWAFYAAKWVAAAAALAFAVMVSGCGDTLKAVQEIGGNLAERQCAKPEHLRQLERLGSYFVLDGNASVKVCCPGEECYEATQKAAKVALQIFNHLQNGDYIAARNTIYESAAELGINLDEGLDERGCFPTKHGIAICLQTPAPPTE